MTTRLFTDEDAGTWTGGSYELAMYLGPRSDARLEAALLTLWQNSQLEGCFLGCDLEPREQERVEPSLRLLEHGQLYGIATLPGGHKVACGTYAVREESGMDWLCFHTPVGALSTAYDVGAFPYDDGKDSQTWRKPVDRWLVELAQEVFAVAPFALALIGHEVSGTVSAVDIAAKGIPGDRWDGYLWAEDGRLIWYTPTIYTVAISIGG